MAAPAVAHADDSAVAEQLFQEGLAAMKRGDYPVACEAFAQSNKSDPSAGTMINLAVCYEKQKKWASAWSSYRTAVGLAEKQKNKEREQLAEEAATRIKPNIHYVIVSVKEPLSDLVVKKDGEPVTITLAGKETPIPVDPGEHALEVSARGKKTWNTTIKVADNNQTDRIDVPKLEAAPVDAKSGNGGTGSEYRPPVIVTNDGSGQRTVGIIVGGAGLLAGLACGGMFILANNEASERDKQRDAASKIVPGSTPTAKDEQDALNKSADSHNKAANNNQLIAIIVGASAVVLVGIGAVLYFTAPKSTSEKAALVKKKLDVTPVPLLGSGFGGLGLAGTF